MCIYLPCLNIMGQLFKVCMRVYLDNSYFYYQILYNISTLFTTGNVSSEAFNMNLCASLGRLDMCYFQSVSFFFRSMIINMLPCWMSRDMCFEQSFIPKCYILPSFKPGLVGLLENYQCQVYVENVVFGYQELSHALTFPILLHDL